jgi:hypothetical protein
MYLLYCIFPNICTDLYRVPAKQSQSEIPLKINIAQTIEVSTATATAQEDIKPSYIVVVSSPSDKRNLSSLLGLRADDYTLIRLFDVRDRSLLDTICCAQVEMEVTDCLFQQNYGGKD